MANVINNKPNLWCFFGMLYYLTYFAGPTAIYGQSLIYDRSLCDHSKLRWTYQALQSHDWTWGTWQPGCIYGCMQCPVVVWLHYRTVLPKNQQPNSSYFWFSVNSLPRWTTDLLSNPGVRLTTGWLLYDCRIHLTITAKQVVKPGHGQPHFTTIITLWPAPLWS